MFYRNANLSPVPKNFNCRVCLGSILNKKNVFTLRQSDKGIHCIRVIPRFYFFYRLLLCRYTGLKFSIRHPTTAPQVSHLYRTGSGTPEVNLSKTDVAPSVSCTSKKQLVRGEEIRNDCHGLIHGKKNMVKFRIGIFVNE